MSAPDPVRESAAEEWPASDWPGRDAAIHAMRSRLGGRVSVRDEEALDALTAAGYRLAGPGEVVVRSGSGAALIAAERARQIEAEGWAPEHDDQYTDGELTRAATFYAQAARIAAYAEEGAARLRAFVDRHFPGGDRHADALTDVAAMRHDPVGHHWGRDRAGRVKPPDGWPWAPEWWKPSNDPVANLVRAGALIAAELDRLARATSPAEPTGLPQSRCEAENDDTEVCGLDLVDGVCVEHGRVAGEPRW